MKLCGGCNGRGWLTLTNNWNNATGVKMCECCGGRGYKE